MAGPDPERKIFPEMPQWQPSASEALLEEMALSKLEDSYFASIRLRTGAELGYKYINGLMELGLIGHMPQEVVDELPKVRGRQPNYLELTPDGRAHMLEAISDRLERLTEVRDSLLGSNVMDEVIDLDISASRGSAGIVT